VISLLAYGAEFEPGGNAWPHSGYEIENPTNGWDRGHGVSWRTLLHRNLATALQNIAA
jgi:hypothetical protein